MAEQQRTFGAVVGMEPVVPTRPHPDDWVVTEDGEHLQRRHACVDCQGRYWSNDSERFDADVTIVEKVLDNYGKWVCEYATENEDFAESYVCCVLEGHYDWDGLVREWMESNRDDYDDIPEDVVPLVCYDLHGTADFEAEYHPSEYASYSGSGCCIDSFDLGELEEQIDILSIPELKVLHESGELDDILDEVNCDVYVSRHRRREKNESTGYYEPVGRKTYDNGSVCPNLLVYVSPGGQWRFVFSADRMNEAVDDALAELADSNE